MARPLAFVGFAVLTAALFLTAGWSDAYQKETQPQPKKGTLPANFKKLGLTEEQLKKVYEVRGNFATKIDDLKTKIKGMQKDENDELMKILTDEQKTLLKKILTDKIPPGKDKDKAKDPAKDEKKAGEQSAVRAFDTTRIAALERRIDPFHRRDS